MISAKLTDRGSAQVCLNEITAHGPAVVARERVATAAGAPVDRAAASHGSRVGAVRGIAAANRAARGEQDGEDAGCGAEHDQRMMPVWPSE